MSICLSACLYVYQFTLSFSLKQFPLSSSPFVCVCMCVFVCMRVTTCDCVYTCMSMSVAWLFALVCLYVARLFLYMFVCLPVCLSVCPSFYLYSLSFLGKEGKNGIRYGWVFEEK